MTTTKPSSAVDELAEYSLDALMQLTRDGTERYVYKRDAVRIITAQEQRLGELKEHARIAISAGEEIIRTLHREKNEDEQQIKTLLRLIGQQEQRIGELQAELADRDVARAELTAQVEGLIAERDEYRIALSKLAG